MLEFILNVLCTAAIFSLIVPKVKGAYFNGGFGSALLHGLLFQAVMSVVGALFVLACVFFTLATLGLGIFIVIIVALFAFVIIPAWSLKVQAHFFPETLGFASWQPVLIVSLVLAVFTWVIGSLDSTTPALTITH